jgi:LuxR family maltose regulon positive regulatory protein
VVRTRGPVPPAPGGDRPLSVRERAVLARVPLLETNAEIAAALGVGPETVKTQLASVYRKLGVGRRRDAARRAGLVP